MNKAATLTSFLFVSLSGLTNAALAVDIEQSLGGGNGATDYYKVSCGADTSRLGFKLTDKTPPPTDVQQINLRVEKVGTGAQEGSAASGESAQVALPGGNGRYRIALNTAGTSPIFSGKQRYVLNYRCVAAEGAPTRPASGVKTGSIKMGRSQSLSVKCSSRKGLPTDQLTAQLANTTIAGQVLTAQIVHGSSAVSTSDGIDASVNRSNALTDYYLTVGSTLPVSGSSSAKQYSFAAHCLNASNQDAAEPTVSTLQDQ